MDKVEQQNLRSWASDFGIELSSHQIHLFSIYMDELWEWNKKMNLMGRLTTGEQSFAIAAARGITLNEAEIAALAQAKAAHVAGVRILLQRLGIAAAELDRFCLAGGFANYIDVDNAIAIGLIPGLPLERIDKIGNGSIVGACKVLLSVAARRSLEEFVETVEHVELETDPAFFDIFVEGCMFTPLMS